MKDLETIIPMLREFLNERGLNDVKVEITLSDVPLNVVNETHSDVGAKEGGAFKIVNTENGSLNLFAKYTPC